MINIPMSQETSEPIRNSIQELYTRTKRRVDAALPQFESVALTQCFVPSSEPQPLAASPNLEEEKGGGDEAVLDKELVDLRRGISLVSLPPPLLPTARLVCRLCPDCLV